MQSKSVFDLKKPSISDYSLEDNYVRLMQLACQAQPLQTYSNLERKYTKKDTLDLPLEEYRKV